MFEEEGRLVLRLIGEVGQCLDGACVASELEASRLRIRPGHASPRLSDEARAAAERAVKRQRLKPTVVTNVD
jgi:hypothetical protein